MKKLSQYKNWMLAAGILLALLILLDARVQAQATPTANADFTVEVSDPVYPTLSPAVRDLPPYQASEITLDVEINPRQNATGNVYTGPGGLLGGVDSLLAIQAAAAPATPNGFTTPIFNFDGQGYTFVNPPDTVGDVGTNHYIQMINSSGTDVAIYDKATATLITQFALTSLGGCSTGSGDPVVLYDEMADRWLLSEFGSGSSLCVFVSQTADPTGSYYSYQFPTPDFPDYPKYGVWPDAYYLSTNENSPAAYALDRNAMLMGSLATSQRFTGSLLSGFGFQAFTPSDLDGSTLPPAGAPNYFMRHRDTEAHGAGNCVVSAGQDCLEIWAFDVDFVTPANSTFTEIAQIPIADIDSELCGFFAFACFPMPGSGTTLDPIREVIMFRLAYRNFGSHQTLVGNLVTDVDGTDHGGVRWFELRKQGAGAWSLFQEGTYAPDIHHRWMGAIAMDGEGNIALGYNVSSTTQFPSLRYVGRLVSDPLGTMPQGEAVLINGTGSNGSNRYGDYAAMSVDPVDDCTFWFTGQYNTGSNWSTRIGAFKFDACGSPDFTLSVDPTTQAICTPDDAVFNVNIGQVQGYTDQVTLSALGNPAGTTTNFSTNPVTPPGTSALTIGNTGSAAPGNYSIEVMGVAATSTHTATVTLDIFSTTPGALTLVSPANGATNVPLAPTFSWNTGTGAQTYALEIATDSGFTNVIYSATGLPVPTHSLTGTLDPVTTYYWHVRAENICGDGSYSSAFSFTTASVPPILLVDDDDNGPDVLATYTSALDNLGMSYDIWDTNGSDTEPSATQLAPYSTVIWFTGGSFGGAAGPGSAGETALGTWLDSENGCFFISSQDYHYDRDTTPFMTNYLGASTITDDDGDYTSVTGQGTVFGALGSSSLVYPFTDYSDPITPNGTAELAFLGNNGNGAAINKETATYKTTFWVFPWEAISTAPAREAAMQTYLDWCGTNPATPMIDVSPESLTSTQAPNSIITQTLTINNLGDADLTWAIDEDNPVNTPVSGSTARLDNPVSRTTPLAPASFFGTIVGDGGFEGGSPNAYWSETSTNFFSLICDVGACGVGGGTGPHTGTMWAWFGGIDVYEEGTMSQSVTLPSGAATLSFWLEVPVACDSTADYLEVLVDGTQVFLVDGSSALCGVVGYSLQTVDISTFADGGSHNLEFHSEIFGTNATVTNFFVDDVAIDVSGPPAACSAPSDIPWVTVTPASGTTAPASSTDVTVTLDSTSLAEGVYTGTLCITSDDPANPLVTVPLTLTVDTPPAYGVTLSGDAAATGLAGETVSYVVTITNTGTTTDTFDLAASGIWTTTLSDTSVTLASGASVTFTVDVSVPGNAADGDSDATTVTATSQGNPSVTDSATLITTAEVSTPPSFNIFLPLVQRN